MFQTPYFSSDNAYYEVRHTEHIVNNISPLIEDDLSYGGRTSLVSPIYHYFLAFFALILPDHIAFKIIPEILLASLTIIIFFITRSITKNTNAALISSFMSGFIPIVYKETINQASIFSIVLVLSFYAIFSLLNLKKHLASFIILSFLLPLLHPFSFVISVAFLMYLILISIESFKVEQLTKESIAFFIFVSVLINLIIFKRAFLESGILAVWHNLPDMLIENFFKGIDIFDIIVGIGFVPLILGIIGFVFGIFKQRKQAIYLLGGLILTLFILLFLRLITFSTGIMFLGLLLTIMSALAIEKFIAYINITKFKKFKKQIFVISFALILLSLLIPTYIQAKEVISNTINQDEVNTLLWLKSNTPKTSTILASVEEGNYITAISERKNVADTDFLLAPDRYKDVTTIFKTESLVIATQLMHKYSVDYLYVSDRALKHYGIDSIKYIGDENCFNEVYSTESTKVYRLTC